MIYGHTVSLIWRSAISEMRGSGVLLEWRPIAAIGPDSQRLVLDSRSLRLILEMDTGAARSKGNSTTRGALSGMNGAIEWIPRSGYCQRLPSGPPRCS